MNAILLTLCLLGRFEADPDRPSPPSAEMRPNPAEVRAAYCVANILSNTIGLVIPQRLPDRPGWERFHFIAWHDPLYRHVHGVDTIEVAVQSHEDSVRVYIAFYWSTMSRVQMPTAISIDPKTWRLHWQRAREFI